MKFTFLLLLLLPTLLFAEEVFIELEDGTEVPVEKLAANGDRALLWLPSEFGYSPRQQPAAEVLAKSGIEVWMPDLHSGYFIAPGRYSLKDFPVDMLLDLMMKVQRESGKQVYLFVSGRMSAKTLEAVHKWQKQGMSREQVGGIVLVSPKLYTSTPQGGEEAVFIPAARATNIPVYLFQPVNTAQYWRIRSVQEALLEGGAQVYLHKLENAADGFHLRPLDDVEPRELAVAERLPGMLNRAIELLASTEADYSVIAPLPKVRQVDNQQQGSALLKPYEASHPTPALKLSGLDGKPLDLANLRGKVVVLNFWATWCPPCVEEIPSLERLYKRMKSKGVEVVSVDVGEEADTVEKFLVDKPVGFPVLLDPQAKVFTEWKSYAFPTTFVLDQEQVIRYAVFGAFEWDSEEVIRTLETLLESS